MLRNLRGLAEEFIHRYYHRPRRIRAFRRQTDRHIHTTPAGLKFELDPTEFVDYFLATEGVYERRFLRFMRANFPAGGVMIDVGANIGNHALYLHDLCSAVHCYEPNPVVAARLYRNIELNGIRNVFVHQFGLGDRNGDFPFASNKIGNLGNSGFIGGQAHRDGNYDTLKLPLRVADEAIDELKLSRIDLIKLDVEGLEPEVIHGLRHAISRFRPLVAFEFHGQFAPSDAFETIRSSMPDYTFADVTYAADDSGIVSKVIYHLKNGNDVALREVVTPNQRTYESMLAIPNDHVLRGSVQS